MTEPRIKAFGFRPGRVISGRFKILDHLGSGWEGEVYLVRESDTGIERALKLFFPHRNLQGEASKRYARKLHTLRHCPIIIQYHVQGTTRVRGATVTYIVFDYAPGEALGKFLARQPGQRLSTLAGLHLLYALTCGLEAVHAAGEYHGDLHTENVIVARFGLTFDLKVLDFFHQTGSRRSRLRGDVVDVIRIFYDSLGGARHYAKQPDEVKAICRGLKHSLIIERFPTLTRLKAHLEAINWVN